MFCRIFLHFTSNQKKCNWTSTLFQHKADAIEIAYMLINIVYCHKYGTLAHTQLRLKIIPSKTIFFQTSRLHVAMVAVVYSISTEGKIYAGDTEYIKMLLPNTFNCGYHNNTLQQRYVLYGCDVTVSDEKCCVKSCCFEAKRT